MRDTCEDAHELSFQVDDKTNKITQLRRECTAETCGAGIFMAMHKDRHHCGRVI